MKQLCTSIILFFITLILMSCSSIKRLDIREESIFYEDRTFNEPHNDIGYYWNPALFTKFFRHNNSLFDELTTTFYESGYQFKNIDKKELLFSTKWELKTYNKPEEIEDSLPRKFLNYMPNAIADSVYFQKKYVNELIETKRYRIISVFRIPYLFNIVRDLEPTFKKESFDEIFSVESDLIHSVSEFTYRDNYAYDPDQLSKLNYKYLFLHLPTSIFIKNFMTKGSFSTHPRTIESKHVMLKSNELLLEPTFYKYDQDVKYLWQLAQFKIKYEILADTLKYPNIGYEIDWDDNDQIMEYNHLEGSSFIMELNTDDIQKYIAQEIIKNNFVMHKSYFKLILWQLYKPNDFEVKDNNGEKRSFLFISNNPDYPGNYEVKFNIYEPYNFKVFKR